MGDFNFLLLKHWAVSKYLSLKNRNIGSQKQGFRKLHNELIDNK